MEYAFRLKNEKKDELVVVLTIKSYLDNFVLFYIFIKQKYSKEYYIKDISPHKKCWIAPHQPSRGLIKKIILTNPYQSEKVCNAYTLCEGVTLLLVEIWKISVVPPFGAIGEIFWEIDYKIISIKKCMNFELDKPTNHWTLNTLPRWCSMCTKLKETVNHLLLNCEVV